MMKTGLNIPGICTRLPPELLGPEMRKYNINSQSEQHGQIPPNVELLERYFVAEEREVNKQAVEAVGAAGIGKMRGGVHLTIF